MMLIIAMMMMLDVDVSARTPVRDCVAVRIVSVILVVKSKISCRSEGENRGLDELTAIHP